MSIIVTGSIAYDYLMTYPGHFREHILLDQTGKISVSFLVEEMQLHRGGIGPNIAYSLALLGHRPRLMGTAGRDFAEFGAWLEAQGIDTSLVRIYPDEFTATFTAITDLDQNQIAGFHAGAMSRARELSFRDLDRRDIDLVIISPNDPAAMAKYAEECQELKIPFIYDPSQQLARMTGPDLMAGMCDAVAMTVNDYELEMIKQKTGLDERGIVDCVRMLVVTRGADGATLMSKDRRVDVPAVVPNEMRDPTGVGDGFRSGLITGLVHGYSWEVTGRLGALAATYVLEHSGTMNHHYTLPEFVARYRANFGDAPELENLLETQQGGHVI
jgi:adenosine kinase